MFVIPYCKKNFNLYYIFLGFNTSTNEYTLTDDTVLEEHYEDPRLTQMKLVGGPEGNIFYFCNKTKHVQASKPRANFVQHIFINITNLT